MGALSPNLMPLVGSWRLLSWANRFLDTGEREETFGSDPDGRMVLEPGGRIMFLFMRPGRQAPTSDADRVRLFDDMAAYSGLVRSDGPGRLITTVDISSSPFAHPEQLRLFTLSGSRLDIRTPEQTLPRYPGRLLISEIVWLREHPATA